PGRRPPQQPLAFVVEDAVNVDLVEGDLPVEPPFPAEPLPLQAPGPCDGRRPVPHRGAPLSPAQPGLAGRRALDANEKVDAVQDGTGQPAAVAVDFRRPAGTGPFRIVQVPAGARVERPDEGEPRGKDAPPKDPGDRDDTLLQGLPQSVDHCPVKLA